MSLKTVHDILAVKIRIYFYIGKTDFVFIFFCLIFAIANADGVHGDVALMSIIPYLIICKT